ncbi:MAG: hypothetical protein R2785_09450 [Flavobacteriaceae bacterium]
MEIVLTQANFGSLPKEKQEPKPFVFKNEGILTSSYKQEIQNNFFYSKPTSIFGIKQRIKSKQYQYSPSIDAILKLCIFTIVIVALLS